jgi:predicted nucleic acid-binding protein
VAFVADKSVIVGWFIPSQANSLTRKALRLSRREQVHVPALWQPEFASVLVGLERRGLVAGHQVDAIIAKAERLGMEIHDAFPSLSPLIGLMRARGIKAYDATYLHLAASLNAPLYTRDASLRAAARSAGLTAP